MGKSLNSIKSNSITFKGIQKFRIDRAIITTAMALISFRPDDAFRHRL